MRCCIRWIDGELFPVRNKGMTGIKEYDQEDNSPYDLEPYHSLRNADKDFIDRAYCKTSVEEEDGYFYEALTKVEEHFEDPFELCVPN